MKISHRTKSLVLVVGAVFAFSTVTAHADGKKPAKRHRAKVKTEAVQREVATDRNDRVAEAPVRKALPTIDDRHSEETPGRRTGGANGPEYRIPTGSNLPRKYNRRGYSTDDDRNSFIYDKNDQRIQSRNSVGESLRTVPGVTVRGARGL